MSFPMAMAFSCNGLLAVNSARRFSLTTLFTGSGRIKVTQIMYAMPRASLQSLLQTCC
jgi:hypothetical protein